MPASGHTRDVVRAERKTIETALKKGIHPRVELSDPRDAVPYLEMGVKHFCIGWDVEILHAWWQVNGRQMRELLGGERTRMTLVGTLQVSTSRSCPAGPSKWIRATRLR